MSLQNIQIHKSSYQNNIFAMMQILLQISLIYLSAHFFSLLFVSVNKFNFVVYLFFILFIGTRMRALGNILHECSHFSFSPSKKSNIFFGNLLSILEMSSFSQYQKSHAFHHRYLGNIEKDDDYRKYLCLIKNYKNKKFFNNLFVLYIIIAFNPLNLFYYIINSVSLYEKNKILFVIKIVYLLIITLFCLNNYNFFLFFLIPYFTTYQMMRIFSDFLDHHKIYFATENFLKTRNHIFKSKLLNLIFFPRNDSYHLVHHMYPRAPVSDLPRIHEYLLENNLKYNNRKHEIF